MDRQVMETDIVVTGVGPASAGFLLTLAPELAKTKEDGTPLYESKVMPGMPLQVMCYERADDTGFGVSGIVTKAEAIRKTFPGADLAKEIPNAADVAGEETAYLFDHLGCSKRSAGTKFIDACFKAGGLIMKGGEFTYRAGLFSNSARKSTIKGYPFKAWSCILDLGRVFHKHLRLAIIYYNT